MEEITVCTIEEDIISYVNSLNPQLKQECNFHYALKCNSYCIGRKNPDLSKETENAIEFLKDKEKKESEKERIFKSGKFLGFHENNMIFIGKKIGTKRCKRKYIFFIKNQKEL